MLQSNLPQPPQGQDEFEQCYDKLPPRRREILKLFLQGLSDPEIADQQCIVRSGVVNHITGVTKIFGLREAAYDRCRDDLIALFVRFRPDLVAAAHQPQAPVAYPDGNPLAFDSPLYTPREIAEQRSQQIIQNPGALLRLRAPKQTGKTSLVQRMALSV